MIPTMLAGGGLKPGDTVGFVGLGRMGLPMAQRLAEAGYRIRGSDHDEGALERLGSFEGATAVSTATVATEGAKALVLMLPSSDVVRSILVGCGIIDLIPAGTVVLDMSSSEPLVTRELATLAGDRGVHFVDAPVSGGVRGAVAGSLTILVGGTDEDFAACEPLLGVLGKSLMHVGPVGAGHALKALNNLLSAVHLLASSEAIAIGRRFGLDPETMVAAFNASSGRSASTERKLPDFILPETFDSGFELALMAKDASIASELGLQLGAEPLLGSDATRLWIRAKDDLPAGADHTEIARWVEDEIGRRAAARPKS